LIFSFNNIPKPNFKKPEKINRLVEKLINRGFNMNRPQKNSLEEAVRKFRSWLYQSGAPLTRGECRHLSWALNIGEQKILEINSEIGAAMQLYQEDLVTPMMLKGLIHSFFFSDDVPAENVNLLRSRIRLLLLQYRGRNATIHHWAGLADGIFGSSPEAWVAKTVLLRQNVPFHATFDDLKVPRESVFYRRCIEQLSLKYANEVSFPNRLPEILKTIEALNNTETLKKCIDHVLQGFARKNMKELHIECCNFCVRHLGDPRLRKNVKWNGFSSSSKELVVRWLSTEDLTMFFDLVAMDKDRKSFWLNYVEVIEYSRVVFGRDALELNNSDLKKFLSQKRHAELKNSPRNLSAFILKIKDVIIVEFSHKGNACYFYRANNVPFSLDTNTYSKKNLADLNVVDERRSHFLGWEDKFRECLFEEFNIRQPGVNYW